MTDAIPTPNQLTDLQDKLDSLESATVDARSAAEAADPLADGSYAGDASKTSLVDTPDLEAGTGETVAAHDRWVSDADSAL